MLRMLSHVTLYWWVTINFEIGVLNCKCHTFDILTKLIIVLLALFLQQQRQNLLTCETFEIEKETFSDPAFQLPGAQPTSCRALNKPTNLRL